MINWRGDIQHSKFHLDNLAFNPALSRYHLCIIVVDNNIELSILLPLCL
jgi:hypothetical protein